MGSTVVELVLPGGGLVFAASDAVSVVGFFDGAGWGSTLAAGFASGVGLGSVALEVAADVFAVLNSDVSGPSDDGNELLVSSG